jgi:methylated-DNA-[protein]-cysteine S-methyltransferase
MADKGTGYEAVMSTPIEAVKLGITTSRDTLCTIDFISARHKDRLPRYGLIGEVIAQLRAYFKNPAFEFSLPLASQGTTFQRRVWQKLQDIPRGHAWTYGVVAGYLGSSPRAVGGACRANPVSIIVPCHRVVASNGPGGFGGQTQGYKMTIKQWLLAHEQL